MPKTVTRSRSTTAPGTIKENNKEVDRLVAGFETPLDCFVRHHRGKLHLLAFLLAVAWATPRFPQVLWGLPLLVGGLVIRAWAAGYLAKNTELCVTGPYQYCRHPMYLGNLIILAGICISANNIYLSVTGVVLSVLIYVFSIRREEALLHHLFGEDYVEYCRCTPCLLPRLITCPISQHQAHFFTWSLAMYNGIGEQTAGVVLLFILFMLKAIVLPHFGYNYPVTYGLWPGPLG